MSFTQSVTNVLANYATFSSGRAPRSEYWWFVLFTVLVSWATGLLDGVLFGEYAFMEMDGDHYFTPISTLASLALLLPSLSVGARRFHDLDRSGWWLLIGLTGIGALVIFFWFMVKGTQGPNRFGADPLEARGPDRSF